jgi:hypothetical protein
MEIYRKKYSDETFDLIDALLRGTINNDKFIDEIKEFIYAAAELVCEDHDTQSEKENRYHE